MRCAGKGCSRLRRSCLADDGLPWLIQRRGIRKRAVKVRRYMSVARRHGMTLENNNGSSEAQVAGSEMQRCLLIS